jgi:hypothetical protein
MGTPGRERMRPFAFAVLLVVTTASRGTAATSSPSVGTAIVQANGNACVMLRGKLRADDRVLLFLFSPPRVVDGRILSASRLHCNPHTESEDTSYEVALRHAIGDRGEIGVAVHDSSARVEYADGEFIVYTAGKPAPLRFRQCASSEGIHLTAWRGDRRAWHAYWYVGIDLEANCSDAEAEP